MPGNDDNPFSTPKPNLPKAPIQPNTPLPQSPSPLEGMKFHQKPSPQESEPENEDDSNSVFTREPSLQPPSRDLPVASPTPSTPDHISPNTTPPSPVAAPAPPVTSDPRNRNDTVNADLEGDSENPIKMTQSLSLTSYLIIAFMAIVVGILFYYWYYILQPSLLLKQAFSSFLDLRSAKMLITIAPQDDLLDTSLEIQLHDDDSLLSYFSLKSRYKDDSGFPKDFSISSYLNSTEAYITASHTDLSSLDEDLSELIIPIDETTGFPLTELESYKLIRKVLLDDYWLHIKNLNSTDQTQALAKTQQTSEIIEANSKELSSLFYKSIKIIKIDRSHQVGNEQFRYITFGFKKEELMNFFTRYAQLDENLHDSLNEIDDFLSSVENLDSEIVEVYISKNTEQLTQIKINTPKIDENYLDNKAQQLKNSSSYSQYTPDYIFNSLKNTINTRYDKPDLLLTINISDHDTLARLNPPALTVEFTELTQAFENEKEVIIPLLLIGFNPELFQQPTPDNLQ